MIAMLIMPYSQTVVMVMMKEIMNLTSPQCRSTLWSTQVLIDLTPPLSLIVHYGVSQSPSPPSSHLSRHTIRAATETLPYSAVHRA